MKNLTRVAIAFIKNDRTHFLHERMIFYFQKWYYTKLTGLEVF